MQCLQTQHLRYLLILYYDEYAETKIYIMCYVSETETNQIINLQNNIRMIFFGSINSK